MWKLITICMARLDINEFYDEIEARHEFNVREYRSSVLYAFLYNPKGNLEETYINQRK